MASNQAVSDGALYLYRCITSSNCTINWDIVGATLDLKPGTASKRYSRLRQRIDNTNATLSSKWSGDLDAEGEFLLECITSCKCQIDFNAIGQDCNLKPGTASKRYTRLLAKYKDSAGASTNEPAAGLSVKTPSTPATGSQKKRKTTLKNESDSGDDTPSKKRKVNTPASKSAQGRRVKREESEEIVIPTTDGAGDILPAERKTRGLKVQYQVDEVSDSEMSTKETEADDEEFDIRKETADEFDDYMSDSNGESEGESKGKSKAMGLQVVRRLQTTSTSPTRNASISRLQDPANIPIGLTGWKMLHSGAAARYPVIATSTASTPTDLVSLTSLNAEETEYESASEEIDVDKNESEMRTPHGAQLHTELAIATLLGDNVGTKDVAKDIVESIENAEEPRVGFFARMLPWWK